MLITADKKKISFGFQYFFLLTIEDKKQKKMVVYCKMKTSSP